MPISKTTLSPLGLHFQLVPAPPGHHRAVVVAVPTNLEYRWLTGPLSSKQALAILLTPAGGPTRLPNRD
jgi:hypothetical protein